MEMVNDWYTHAEAMVYSRLRWLSYATDWADFLYPSQSQIAKDLCLEERHVRRCLNVLEKNWLIEISRRWYKRRNNYYVCDIDIYPCKLPDK